MVTETWLHDKDSAWMGTNSLAQAGFTLNSMHRTSQGGGGIMLICLDHFQVRR